MMGSRNALGSGSMGSCGRALATVATGLAAAVLAAAVMAAPAGAQIPAVPEVPDLPPEVQEAIESAEDALVPVLTDVALEAQVVANLLGVALRPACSLAGTGVLLLTLAAPSLPLSVGFLSVPLLMWCAGAYAEGPADAVFEEVDAVVGEEIDEALAPVYEAENTICTVIGLLGSAPKEVPPPLNRVDVVRLLCS